MKRFGGSSRLISKFICFCVILSFALAEIEQECGRINPKQFENMETDTQIDEFPWMAKIAYRNNDSHTAETRFSCHAVLIDQQHLLTNGHCVGKHVRATPYAVLFGDWNSENEYTEEDCDASGKCTTPFLIEIDGFTIYPSTDNNKYSNDIAILRLSQKVTYSDFIQPICLPTNDMKSTEFGSKKLTITGWLRKNKGLKQKGSDFAENSSDCHKKYETSKDVDIKRESHICGNSCFKNEFAMSGSALMDVINDKAYLVGLLSFGFSSCRLNIPDVFVRVDNYLDWIENSK